LLLKITLSYTGAAQYFHLADQIVVLGTDGRIAESGTYDTLRAQTGYISSILLKSGQPNSDEGQNRPAAMKMVKGVSENDGQDLSRKTGDMSIYSK
jgi:ATP-binding cassette subfamily C (CFTR/MRP) protein 1